MPRIVVGTDFTARDKGISTIFKKLSRGANLFKRDAASAFDRATRSANKFKGLTSTLLKTSALQQGIGLLSRGVSSVVTQFIEFDDSIMAAGARFKDIGPDVDDFKTAITDIRKSARAAGATTEFTAAQAAKGLDFLARAGFSSTEAIGALVPMINLATASGEDFARVSDMSSDLLGAFGLAADTTSEKINSLKRLNDVLVKSANSANVTIEDQFETMKQAAPIARSLKIPVEELTAVTDILGNAGLKGSLGATVLKNALLRLTSFTPKAAGAMQKLGLRMEDITILTKDGKRDMMGITDILRIMKPRLDKLGTQEQADVMNAIFGKRAIAGVSSLLRKIDKIDHMREVLDNAGGASAKTANVMRESLGKQLESLQSAAAELGFKFLGTFRDDGVTVIKSLTEWIRKVDVKPIIGSIDFLISAFKILFSVMSFFSPVFPVFIAGFVAFKGASMGFAALDMARRVKDTRLAMFLLTKTQGLLTLMQQRLNFQLLVQQALTKGAMFLNWAKGLRAVMFAQKLLNIVMRRSPIFLVAIAIIGIGKAVIFLVKKLKEIEGKPAQSMKDFFKSFEVSPEKRKRFEAGIFGEDVDQVEEKRAPNEAAEKSKQIGFMGRLIFENAPENLKIKTKTTGAPPIQIERLGVNIA